MVSASVTLAATITLLVTLIAPTADAAQLQGRVVHVIDGDGLIVLIGDKRVNVRLEHIDAPERGQAYGHQSRQSLIAICGGELATIDASGKDRNGRTLAQIHCNGVDAGAEQVRRGMAMVFDRYAPADSPLYAAQREARLAHRGLWADGKSVPPWEWREQRRPTSRSPAK